MRKDVEEVVLEITFILLFLAAICLAKGGKVLFNKVVAGTGVLLY